MTSVRLGLDAEAAQKVLDFVAARLVGLEFETAERLLDEFVDRMRHLDDIAAVQRAIEQSDGIALEPLGGLEQARTLIELIAKITAE